MIRAAIRSIRRGMRRRAMGDAVLDTVAILERAGCRIEAAAVIPEPAIHIDRPPADCDTCGYVEPNRLVRRLRLPVIHFAYLGGVRITWSAAPQSHQEPHHV